MISGGSSWSEGGVVGLSWGAVGSRTSSRDPPLTPVLKDSPLPADLPAPAFLCFSLLSIDPRPLKLDAGAAEDRLGLLGGLLAFFFGNALEPWLYNPFLE